MFVNLEPSFMKGLIFLPLISFIALFACHKSSINSSEINTAGGWQLAEKNSVLGPYDIILKPSKDSSVLLILNSNSTYTTELNGITVSSGSYSIAPDTSDVNEQVLQLNNFKTTGIFSLFTVYELGGNNQVLSDYDGFTMKTSNDTLMLYSVTTPGGWETYTFVKK
jgi:hypothetical protein